MGELIHISHIRIESEGSEVRRAHVERMPTMIRFGVHGGVRKFYKVPAGEDLPTTLDHMIAGVGG